MKIKKYKKRFEKSKRFFVQKVFALFAIFYFLPHKISKLPLPSLTTTGS